MVGPGDQSAAGAGGYGYLRASHADRELVVGALKAAFVQGRLAKDEFDLRIDRVLASRTYADLNALTTDLPPGLIASQLTGPTQEPDNDPAVDLHERKVAAAWACATIAGPSVAVAVALIASGAAIGLVLLAVFLFASMVAMPVTGLVMLHSWPDDPPSSGLSG